MDVITKINYFNIHVISLVLVRFLSSRTFRKATDLLHPMAPRTAFGSDCSIYCTIQLPSESQIHFSPLETPATPENALDSTLKATS